MSENPQHETRTAQLPRVTLDRWLPQKHNYRLTVLVFSVLAGTTLLLYSSGDWRPPAALSVHFSRLTSAAGDHFHRLTSAAYRRFSSGSPAGGSSAAQPLSGVYCSAECPCACRSWRGPHDADPPQPARSNCGPTADRRGAHQNVLAYTFFGTNVTAYLDGIEDNARRALRLYPGWSMRIYHDGNANLTAWNATACDISCGFPNVDLCDVRHLPGLGDISNQTATIWRFAVIADESVDRFLMRDLDSILTKRERSAVDEWLKSNKTFHTMRDHPYHGSEVFAGMWGGWNRFNEKYRVMRRQMLEARNPRARNLSWDQHLLRSVLWPELLRTGDVMTHDSYQCLNFPYTRPFPTQRRSMTEFVGSQFTRKTLTVQKECPVACRPPEHKDWKYC